MSITYNSQQKNKPENASLIDGTLTLFFAQKTLSADDFIRNRIETENFLLAIDAPNFQSTIKALLDDPSLIDGDEKKSSSFIKVRAERLRELGEMCECIVERDGLYEEQLRLVQRMSKEPSVEGRRQIGANLKANTARLVRELNSMQEGHGLY
jgi:hypothetical protein